VTLLPDGSEKGLRGYAEERGVRTRKGLAPPAGTVGRGAPYKRIATEEAWTFPELVKAQVEYGNSDDAPNDASLRMGTMFAGLPRLQGMLQDIGEGRIAHMDEYGIDRQLLLLTAPGVQVVRERDGTALAREANDRAAESCRNWPDRYSALAAFDPRDVAGSVKEIDRAMGTLKLNGAVLNSHFQGRYIDEPAYEPILEALEHHDAALYIHPTAPPDGSRYQARGFFGAVG
jgi:predicted TIM-barrel fold metal-dependent hydrolase